MTRALFSLVLTLALFVGVVALLRAWTRRSLGALLPIAAAVHIAIETCLFNVLSIAHLVTPMPVALANALLVLLVALGVRRSRIDLRALAMLVRFRLRNLGALWMLAPLAALLAVTAWVYPPTNWDSMTYHLARVAHWMSNRSVAYFRANQDAQNTMGPGAEYVLLQLQVVAGEDTWANSVQLFAWLLCVVSVPTLARLLGLPRDLAPWAGVFVGALPLATLEATTTQNDLVASLMTLAVVSASIPLFRRRVPRMLDLGLLGLAAGVSFLVKPTASLCALPFAAFAFASAVVPLCRSKGAVTRFGALLGPLLVVVGPDAARKLRWTGSLFGGRNEVYPLFGLWGDRLFNAIRSYCQNALFPERTNALVQAWQRHFFHAPTRLFTENVFRSNEDRGGNPLHAALTLVLIGWLLATIVVLPRSMGVRRRWRLLAIAASVPAAWLVLHAFLRNSASVQEFITRLQMPVFMLTPLVWIPFAAPIIPGHRVRGLVLRVVTIVVCAAGFLTAARNEFRPLSATFLASHRTHDELLYATRPDVEHEQDRILQRLAESGCHALGLHADAQFYDYPLTWRARRIGIEVRPYVSPSRWPCAVFSDRGRPPEDADVRFVDEGNGLWRRATP